MRYMGGKARIAKRFAPILAEALDSRKGQYVEPFTGGFNIVPQISDHISKAVCADIHPGVIKLWSAVQSGEFDPPNCMDRETYAKLKETPNWDDPLTAFAAFACSFGGKEFGGFVSDGVGKRNFADESRRAMVSKIPHMANVQFVCDSFDKLSPKNNVVYCDPPYIGTTAYKTGEFDYAYFLDWCRLAIMNDCRVFLSEFTIPEGVDCEVVWQLDRKVSLSKTDYASNTELLIEILG